MTQDQIIVGLFYVALVLTFVAAWVLRLHNRGRKRIVLTDYRRGVHFVGGTFKSVLGPGSYSYDTRKEQITIVDMRPQPILIERLAFQDALRHDGVISIGTELLVRDPHLAATTLRDEIKDAYVMVRETVRNSMSKQIAAGSENYATLADEIKKAVDAEVSRVGMGVSEIEITELSSQFSRPQTAGVSETIQ